MLTQRWIPCQNKPERIANRDACAFVTGRRAFIGSNIFSEWAMSMVDDEEPDEVKGERMYVVYSYGRHWPLYIYHQDTGVWYENDERCSSTTSRHRSTARPSTSTSKVPRDFMFSLMTHGLVETVCAALEPA